MIRIHPAAQPLWRSPDSLQFGLDPELARLDTVPEGVEHLIHALVLGTDRDTLEGLAAEHRVSGAALDALLERLRPALAPPRRTPPTPLTLEIDGPADLLAALSARLQAGPPAAPHPGPHTLVVVAAHHVIAPDRTVGWLARDVPHLAVVFADQAVEVGPLVLPGRTPCLRCAEEHRLDDSARRALTAQLLRRTTSLTSTGLTIGLRVAARIAEAAQQVRDGRPTGLEGAVWRTDLHGGVSRRAAPWHERCRCRWPEGGPRPGGRTPAGASAPPDR